MFDIAASTGHADHVQAACLPSAAGTHGSACWVAGWGTTQYEGTTATTLQEVGVNVFSAAYCVEKTGDFSVYDDEFCAGLPDSDGDGYTDAGADSCQGDSGGPLVCNVNGSAVITGIVSRGVDCGVAGWAGRYGEVYDYLSWIQDKMQNPTRQNIEQAGNIGIFPTISSKILIGIFCHFNFSPTNFGRRRNSYYNNGSTNNYN